MPVHRRSRSAAGARATLLVAAVGCLGLAGCGAGDEFVVVNRTGAPITDMRLIREHADSTTELSRFASIAPGETVRATTAHARSFELTVEFSDAGGRFAARKLVYIDDDETGDRAVTFEPGRIVNGKPATPIR